MRDYATERGWKRTKTEHTQRAIRIMLGIQDTPGAAIRRSDVALLSRIKYSAAVVADVLAAAGMLAEDRKPAVVRWFDATVVDLPAPMRRELDVWFDVMRNGSSIPPRRLPRAENTIGTQLRWALPTLHAWATEHHSLREIGRDDVLAALPDDPMGRYTTMQGLRSIFRILKGRKLVFVNPTTRIHAPSPEFPGPVPVELDKLRQDLNSDAPATAALAGLLAFHAVRVQDLCNLLLTDVRDGPAVPRRAGHSVGPARTATPGPLPRLPAATPGQPRSTHTCSSTPAAGTPPARSPPGGSATSWACAGSASASTASSTRPMPPAGTSAGSSTCSACPSKPPADMPSRSTDCRHPSVPQPHRTTSDSRSDPQRAVTSKAPRRPRHPAGSARLR
ncbi:MAG TPA: hypothetical protein VGJ95_16100 [Pseudonocardiaceae bacterium]